MLAATPGITVTGGLADDSRYDYFVPSVSLVCDGAEALRKTVRTLIREGVDIVKFCNSGDSFGYPNVSADSNPMPDEEVRAICETTRKLGRRLAAHAHADNSIRACIKYGVAERQSVAQGKRVPVRVESGGRRNLKKHITNI